MYASPSVSFGTTVAGQNFFLGEGEGGGQLGLVKPRVSRGKVPETF